MYKKRKICVVTGSRSEYGHLKPVMSAIAENPNLDLAVVAAGMHLSSAFGLTFKEIIKDGFCINAKVKMTPKKDTAEAMAASVGYGIIGMTKAFRKIKPDIVLVFGDRIEALAAALAASYSNIVVAHISGGDKTKAGFDESARHAITKISHIHFPFTRKSARRVKRMGENSKQIFISGDPGLDILFNRDELLSSREIADRYGLDLSRPFILVVQHPVTTEVDKAVSQISKTLNAVKRLHHQTIVICPNADAGGRAMTTTIKESCKKSGFMRAYRSISSIDYLSLLKVADVLVGNSSSGIGEAPSFCLPVVNVGSRQEGREHSNNIINTPYSERSIYKAITSALKNKSFLEKVQTCKNPYNKNGKAAEKIVRVLGQIKIDQNLLQKSITN